MKIAIAVISAFSFIAGCAPKVLIMQTPIVSMTKLSSEGVKVFTEGPAVETKWCADENPVQPNNDGTKHYGMIDQAIYRAHKNTNADFFMNNRFYQQGACVFMSANIAKAGK